MAGFIKIRYNANGLLKNRIINADSIDAVEPFSGPGGRYVEETRSRIFMKDGTKYDMSLSVDDIQKLLNEAGALVAEIQSRPPERPAVELQPNKISTLPSVPANLYKRSVLAKAPAEAARKPAEAGRKPAEGIRKAPEIIRKPAEATALKANDSARKLAEAIRG